MSEAFHTLTIASVRPIAGDAVEVVFSVPEALAATFAFNPGQHMAVRAMIDGAEQQRTYSICSARGGALRLGIRHVAGGVFSSWANAHLKAGSTLEVAAPQGRFTLPPPGAAPRHLLMLAAGAGITPILGMTIEALETEPGTRVTLIYGMRTAASGMFFDELEDLKDRFPSRFDLIPVLSRAGEAETELLQGRMTGDKLKAMAAHRIAMGNVDRAFVCGPGDFIKQCRNALFDLGLPRDKVHHEFFVGRTGALPLATVAAPVQPPTEAAPKAGTIQAIAILDGQRHRFPLAAGQHVLDAALAAGLKPPHSCTAGMCSTCRARVVEGHVTMTANYSLEAWEMQRGFVLTCQALATSDTLVVDYDAM